MGRITESFIGFIFFIIMGLSTLGLLKIFEMYKNELITQHGLWMFILFFLIAYLIIAFLVTVVAKHYALKGARGMVIP
jgi:ABC-type multidrug transport system permease subunit